jgi:hypothetical protein
MMRHRELAPLSILAAVATALLGAGIGAVPALAQTPPATPPAPPSPRIVGDSLGITTPGPTGTHQPMSRNVRVFGSVMGAESCTYDAARGLIVVPNRGANQRVLANDGFVSLLNHDGSVHTTRWIGLPPAAARRGFTLNDPFGSDIVDGVLYLSDSDGNTTADDPRVAVIRKFTLATGIPAGEIRVPQATWLNDIAVARDGTIYGTQTGAFGANGDPATWKVFRISADGSASVFVQGAPLRTPNGIALDGDGNVVVLNMGDSAVLTFSPAGQLVRTEQAAQAGNDGLVIMADGTKYVSSVIEGGVSRIRPGRPAELIARNIPNAASMCYDAGAKQLVIPLNDQNGVAFIKLP